MITIFEVTPTRMYIFLIIIITHHNFVVCHSNCLSCWLDSNWLRMFWPFIICTKSESYSHNIVCLNCNHYSCGVDLVCPQRWRIFKVLYFKIFNKIISLIIKDMTMGKVCLLFFKSIFEIHFILPTKYTFFFNNSR